MFKHIIIIFLFIFLFVYLLEEGPFFSNIYFGNYTYENYSLFIPTIIFLILLFLAEKSNSEKTKMKYAIASIVLAIVSWIGFFVYNNYFLWN